MVMYYRNCDDMVCKDCASYKRPRCTKIVTEDNIEDHEEFTPRKGSCDEFKSKKK
jgi:hypothetical protein